jgi:hypothetical protein
MPRHPAPPPPLPPWGQPAPHLVDKARLALECEVGAPAVSGWVKKGLPVRDDGLADLGEVVAWVLATFDPMNGHATRATAREVQRWLYALGQERCLLQIATEHAAAAAHEAANAAGLADHAEALADAVAAEMAARMNLVLEGEANTPLPPPPAGVWRRAVAE